MDENFEVELKAADSGDVDSAFKVAMCYKDGSKGLRVDLGRYAYYLKRCADSALPTDESLVAVAAKNIALASLLVARACKYGSDGFDRDDKASEYYYFRAADGVNGNGSGHILACRIVGTLFEGKNGVKSDAVKALHYLTLAADGGDGPSMIFVAKSLLSTNPPDEATAKKYLEKYLFRERLEKEILNFADYGTLEGDAVELYVSCILHGESRACVDFLNKLPPNFGSPQMRDSLFGWHYVQLKQFETALPFLHRGIKSGNLRCVRCLAHMYAHGFGVEKDYAQAKYYLELGSDGGDETCIEALHMLPEMMKTTNGKSKNKGASKWGHETRFRK